MPNTNTVNVGAVTGSRGTEDGGSATQKANGLKVIDIISHPVFVGIALVTFTILCFVNAPKIWLVNQLTPSPALPIRFSTPRFDGNIHPQELRKELEMMEEQLTDISGTLRKQSKIVNHAAFTDENLWSMHAPRFEPPGLGVLQDEILRATMAFNRSFEPVAQTVDGLIAALKEYKQSNGEATQLASEKLALHAFYRLPRGLALFQSSKPRPASRSEKQKEVLCNLHRTNIELVDEAAAPFIAFRDGLKETRRLARNVTPIGHTLFYSPIYSLDTTGMWGRITNSQEMFSLREIAIPKLPLNDTRKRPAGITLYQTDLPLLLDNFKHLDDQRDKDLSAVHLTVIKFIERLLYQRWYAVERLIEEKCPWYMEYQAYWEDRRREVPRKKLFPEQLKMVWEAASWNARNVPLLVEFLMDAFLGEEE